jgi:hypothetical protein
MNPRRAARRFARLVTEHRSFLDLVEGVVHEQQVTQAFAAVEKAVWRSERLQRQNDLQLAKAVLASVPAKRRKKLAEAFAAYQNAESNYLLVREEAAYLVGVEVGRRTRQ